jgi:hypothetical protein
VTFTQKTYRKILNAAHVLTSASGAGDASNPAFDMAKWKQQDYAASARWEREQAQTKGIGAALGLLGGLVQAAQERYRAMEAKIEREEQKEEAAWEAWKSRSQTLAAQRAEQ